MHLGLPGLIGLDAASPVAVEGGTERESVEPRGREEVRSPATFVQGKTASKRPATGISVQARIEYLKLILVDFNYLYLQLGPNGLPGQAAL